MKRAATPRWARGCGGVPRWLGVALALAPVLAGCSSEEERPRVAAVVEGVKIPSAETEELLRTHTENQEGQDAASQEAEEAPTREESLRFVLLFQIKLAYLDHLAAEAGVPFDPDPEAELAAQAAPPEAFQSSGMRPEDLVRSFQAGRLSKAMAEKLFPDIPVEEAELRAEYDRRAALNASSWRVQASVAYFTAAAPAGELSTRVQRGEPFEEVASALGAVETGDVEITPISPLPQPVLEAVGALQQGQVSAPIQVSTTGWATVAAKVREELPQVTFDEARAELTEFLADRQRQSLFADFFAKKLKTARVEVDDYYGRWDTEASTVR